MRDAHEASSTIAPGLSFPNSSEAMHAPVPHERHDHVEQADNHGHHRHQISHSVALTAEIQDPSTAQHIVEVEKEWAEDNLSDSAVSSTTPATEKNDLSIDAEGLERVQSKASLAVMMANFPDGGRRAWLTLVGATLMAFATFGMTNSFGVYETYYASHQLSNKTSSDIAWIGSFQLFCMFSGGLIAGRLFDTYGPKWLLRVGSIAYFVAFMLLPECKEYWQFFLCQGVLFGIAIASVFFPTVGCVNHYFLKKRAMAIGIMVGGSSLGGLVLSQVRFDDANGKIWPILISEIISKPSLGFAWSARIVAFISAPILIFCNLVLKSRLPPRDPGPIFDFKYFKDPAFSFFSFGFFFILLGMFTPLWYIQQFAVSVGVSKANAFWLLAIINAASLPGRVLPGFYADYVGSFNVMVPCACVTSILLFMWYVITTPVGIYVFAAMYGFFQGAMISLQATTTASICKDLREIGTMMGMSSAVCAVAGLTGTPIAGALLTAGNGSYAAVTGYSAGSIMLGTGMAFVARMYVSKWKLRAKV